MRTFRTFVRHELRTQLRSSRFALLSAVYVLASCVPLLVAVLAASRGRYFVGGAAFAESLLLLQPLATSLFAAILTVDGLSREIDDGSFAVTSINRMTNSSWVAKRWGAMLLFVAAISIVPEIAGWGAAQYFHAGISFLPFFVRWLVFVLPTAVVISALAMGMGTITGRILVAAIVTFILTIAFLSFGNDALAHFHRTLDGPWAFVGFQTDPYNEAIWIVRGFNINARFGTDAGADVREAIDQSLPGAALPAGISFTALAGACFYLRRTRRDIRPRPVRPDHPLRTYLRMFNRTREELAPEPKPHALDLLAMAAGVGGLALSVVYIAHRASHYENLAAERFLAETSEGPVPMSPSLRPVALRVEAGLDADGRVTSSSELTLRNDGAGPQRLLSFQLNHALKIGNVRASNGRITTRRLWDRIGAELIPPMAVGESRRIFFSIRGRPETEELNLHGRGSFAVRYRHYASARRAVDLSDLTRSTTMRLITPIRVDLTAADLTPVPRYTSWSLVPSEGDSQETQPAVEGVRPSTDLLLTIRAAPGTVIADSCGSIVRGGERKRSRCTLPIADYRIAGGRLDVITSADGSSLAVIPAHRPPATGYAPALAESVVVARNAWPGLTLPSHLVFVERPIRISDSWLRKERSWGLPDEGESSGGLRIIDEVLFRTRLSPAPVPIASGLIAQALSAERPVAPSEQPFVTTFFRAVADGRLGAEKNRTAVISGFGIPDPRPLLHTRFMGVTGKMRAVLAYLEYRTGPDRLVAGINAFVHRRDSRPGTARELFGDIGAAAQIPLDRFYDDFIEGSALPVLSLKDVVFRRAGPAWIVAGRLENSGGGELLCPLVLRTEFESSRTTLTIDSHQSVAFSFSTPYRPRAVQLDPDRVCYRRAEIGAVDSVEYRGGA